MEKWLVQVRLIGGVMATVNLSADIKAGDKIVICHKGEFMAVYAAPTTKTARIVGTLVDYNASERQKLGAISLGDGRNLSVMKIIAAKAAKQAGYRLNLADYIAVQKYIINRFTRACGRGERYVTCCNY